MESSDKYFNTERGNEGRQGKTRTSSSVHTPAKRSRNTTASTTRDKTSNSRALHTDISSRTNFESVALEESNIHQTSDGFPMPTRTDRINVDLLGLAPQTSNAYQPDDPGQAFFIEPVGEQSSGQCLYHLPILCLRDNRGDGRKALDPMSRWLVEDNTEQCAVLLLPDGQLSIHRTCQCIEMIEPGIEVEIKE